MNGIYWLASYPKAGNTWVRALLTNYRRDAAEPAHLDELDGGWTASLRETFDEWSGIDSGDLTRQQIDHYRPLVYEQIAAVSLDECFLKTHEVYAYNADARPVMPKAATAGVIYVIRNPLDVAVSYAHHRHEPVDDTIRVMRQQDALLAGSNRYTGQLPQRVGSWSRHVCSWVDEPGLNVHVVRYEDLAEHPVTAFTAIVRFAGMEVDAARVQKAVEFSRFERLQSQEAANGFKEKAPTAGAFFREGRVGAWRDRLTAAQVRQLVADHHDVMRRFGYLGPADEVLC